MKKVESEPEPKVNSFGSATQLSLTMWLSCESRLIFHEMFSFGPRCIISAPPSPTLLPLSEKKSIFCGGKRFITPSPALAENSQGSKQSFPIYFGKNTFGHSQPVCNDMFDLFLIDYQHPIFRIFCRRNMFILSLLHTAVKTNFNCTNVRKKQWIS